MSRRNRESSGSQVSLFPFLSILACMIGTLTLMITALALTGMGVGRDEDSVRRSEEFVALQKEQIELQKLIDRFNEQLRQAEQTAVKVAALEELMKTRDAAAALEARVVELRVRDKSAESRGAELAREIERLKKELDALRTELAGRQQRFSRELVRVLPPKGETTTRFKPWFVEADKSGLIVYNESKPWRVAAAAIRTDAKFNAFLKTLTGSEAAQLVVLVRSSGIAAMNAVVAHAEGMGIHCGKLPLAGSGEVDLSGF
jgi:uncharacterized protein YlxW (UPF0749 family)